MVLEIDPEGTLGSVPGLTKRIPETGRQAVEVRSMPTFDLTLIPFLWRPDPDRSILELVSAMADESSSTPRPASGSASTDAGPNKDEYSLSGRSL